MVEYDNEFDNERVKNLAKKKIELQHIAVSQHFSNLLCLSHCSHKKNEIFIRVQVIMKFKNQRDIYHLPYFGKKPFKEWHLCRDRLFIHIQYKLPQTNYETNRMPNCRVSFGLNSNWLLKLTWDLLHLKIWLTLKARKCWCHVLGLDPSRLTNLANNHV